MDFPYPYLAPFLFVVKGRKHRFSAPLRKEAIYALAYPWPQFTTIEELLLCYGLLSLAFAIVLIVDHVQARAKQKRKKDAKDANKDRDKR